MDNFSFKTIAIKPQIVSLTLCVILITSGLCPGATYTVDDDGPADFTTIQAAINASADSDTIIVSQGRYYENIDFRGKAVTVTSTAPANTQVRESTIIDANNNGIVVSFHTGEGPASIIAGLTITAGHAKYGAGICCWNNCSPTISYCLITQNHSQDISDSNGAGIYCQDNSNPNITDCTFSNNSANFAGGGMYNYSSSPTVTGCTFSGNSANYGGGGMCNQYASSPTVTNCALSGNSADTYGGGICCEVNCNPIIRNCTITGNRAATGAGGIDLGDNCDAVITNNIICNSPSGSGIYALYCDPVIAYNNVSGNADGDYDGWAWPGVGDISVDPLFTDPGHWDDNATPSDPADDFWVDGDYHLHYDSLCINAGDPAFVPAPGEVDMDTQPRIRLGTVDMGVDEAGSNPADFDESGQVNLPDFSIFAAAWLSEPDDPQWNSLCDISLPTDDFIDILDLAAYSNQWLWQASWSSP